MKKIRNSIKKYLKVIIAVVLIAMISLYFVDKVQKERAIKRQTQQDKEEIQHLGAMNPNNPLAKGLRIIPRWKAKGEYSLVKVLSSEASMDNMTDWYLNHVEKTDYDYYLIVYSDKLGQGVYTSGAGTPIQKDIGIDDFGADDFSLGNWIDGVTTSWTVDESGTWKEN